MSTNNKVLKDPPRGLEKRGGELDSRLMAMTIDDNNLKFNRNTAALGTSSFRCANLDRRRGEVQQSQSVLFSGRRHANKSLLAESSDTCAKKKNDKKCSCDSCVKRTAGSVASKWEQSDAKAYIQQKLEGDEMHAYWGMRPGEVYDSNKILFHQYKYENFRTNLNSLKKSIKLDMQQIKFDENALKLEMEAFKRGELTSHGNPFYDTSKARESLVKDVKDGRVNAYKNRPRDLRAKRPEYQSFAPNVFTKHFNREIRQENEQVGWQHKRNLRGSKMHHQKNNEDEEKSDR